MADSIGCYRDCRTGQVRGVAQGERVATRFIPVQTYTANCIIIKTFNTTGETKFPPNIELGIWETDNDGKPLGSPLRLSTVAYSPSPGGPLKDHRVYFNPLTLEAGKNYAFSVAGSPFLWPGDYLYIHWFCSGPAQCDTPLHKYTQKWSAEGPTDWFQWADTFIGDYSIPDISETPPPPPAVFTLSVSCAPPEGGSVSVVPQLDFYDSGVSVALHAEPNEGYQFVSWGGDAQGTNPDITVVMDSNKYVIANFTESAKLDVPIVGDILQWLQALFNELKNWILAQLQWLLEQITAIINTVVSALLGPIIDALNWIKQQVLDIWYWITETIPGMLEWIEQKVLDIWTWVTTEIPNALNWIKNTLAELVGSVADLAKKLADFTWQTILDIANSVTDVATKLADFTWQTILDIANSVTDVATKLADFTWQTILDMAKSISAFFDDMTKWIEANILDPLLDAVKSLVDQFFDFVTWIPNIFNAMGSYFMETVHSPEQPRGQSILVKILTWMLPGITTAQNTGDAWKTIFTESSLIPFRVVGELFGLVFNDFMHKITNYIKALKPSTPEDAMVNFNNISSLLVDGLLGLAGLTAAGELVKFLGHVGLGHIAAMIYDMTNYREITGGMVRAFSTAVIYLPATYYFNELVRPKLPSTREVASMYDREIITFEQYSKYLAYEGIPDYWHEPLAHITETPMRYFMLTSVARMGYWDPTFFETQLKRAGYPPDTRKVLLDMLLKTYSETLKGMMSSCAIKRFKEGMTTQGQFHDELMILGYTEQQWPQYLAAAKLDYAYDYTADLIAAYREATRKGNMSLDEYRSTLLGLGIVPERVEAYVLMERARLKPTEKLTPIAPPKPVYETDIGKIEVDTLRRQRRKAIIVRNEEIAGLQALGMSVDYATAIADNDDVRLAEKSTEE